MHDQLELFQPPEQFACDGCNALGEATAGQIPTGWLLVGRGIACLRERGKRLAEVYEIHYCPECWEDEDVSSAR